MKQNKLFKIIQISFILLFALLTISCTESEFVLSPEEKYVVDTTYASKQYKWKLEADSICSQRSDSIYKILVDSIKSEVLTEIELLFKNTKNLID